MPSRRSRTVGAAGSARTSPTWHRSCKTLNLLLLLLNLAGYQVLEVAIGIPREPTVAGRRLIAVDLRTMTYARGTKRAWTPLGSSSAQVALWVEPRFPIALPA